MSYKKLSNSLGILEFWFSEEVQSLWFAKNSDFDETIRKRFGKVYEEIIETLQQENLDMLQTKEEALACVIALDQFSRNMFRDSPKAFATDDLALKVSKMAIQKKFDQQLPSRNHVNFLYMPFMHSERLEDQEEGVRLFSSSGNVEAAGYARQHRDIIERFGRFPHRNVILGRASTVEELEFLKEFPGF